MNIEFSDIDCNDWVYLVDLANFVGTFPHPGAERYRKRILDHVAGLRRQHPTWEPKSELSELRFAKFTEDDNPMKTRQSFDIAGRQPDTVGQKMMCDGRMVFVIAQFTGWVFCMPTALDKNGNDNPYLTGAVPFAIPYEQWRDAYKIGGID